MRSGWSTRRVINGHQQVHSDSKLPIGHFVHPHHLRHIFAVHRIVGGSVGEGNKNPHTRVVAFPASREEDALPRSIYTDGKVFEVVVFRLGRAHSQRSCYLRATAPPLVQLCGWYVPLSARFFATSRPCAESDTARKFLTEQREAKSAREDCQARKGLEATTHAESVSCNQAEGHRTTLHRSIRNHGDARNLQLRLLRRTAVPLRHQVPLRLRMAQLLCACLRGLRRDENGFQPRNGPN